MRCVFLLHKMERFMKWKIALDPDEKIIPIEFVKLIFIFNYVHEVKQLARDWIEIGDELCDLYALKMATEVIIIC